MSRLRYALAATALLAALVSCEKKAPASTAAPATPAATTESGSTSGKNAAYCIIADAPVWSISDSKELTWKAALQIGERVEISQETTTAPQYGADRTFVAVKRSKGDEGWVRQEFLIPDSVPGVITAEKSVIYSDAANTAATANALPRLAVVAVHGKQAADQKFSKVSAYDAVKQILHQGVYVRAEELSTKTDDVQSAILLQLAAASGDATQKEALLGSASKDHPGTVFSQEVANALDALKGPPAVATTTISPPLTMKATKDNVNVRSAPDATSSTIVGQLAAGRRVSAGEKTTDKYTVGDLVAPWYRIADPEGWVFGAYLEEAKD